MTIDRLQLGDITAEEVFDRALEYVRHFTRAQNTVTAAHGDGSMRGDTIAGLAAAVASLALYSANALRIGPFLEVEPALAEKLGQIALALPVHHVTQGEALALQAAEGQPVLKA